MEFDRYFELTRKGHNELSLITAWLDKELGLEYEIEDGTVVTIFGITTQEDKMLNKWLDKNKYQQVGEHKITRGD